MVTLFCTSILIPFGFLRKGALLLDINQWVKNGVNQIHFSGDYCDQIQIKIEYFEKEIIFEKLFTNEDVKDKRQFEFNLNLDYTLPIFDKKNYIPKDFNKKDLYESVFLSYKRAINRRDFAATYTEPMSNYVAWHQMVHLDHPKKVIEEKLLQECNMLKNIIESYEMTDFKDANFVVGESIVLIHLRGSVKLGNVITKNGSKSQGSPFCISFIDNCWSIWSW